jgi:hypothetical protein
VKIFLLAVLALCIPAIAQTSLQPVNFPVFRAFDSNGKRLSGGFLWSFAADLAMPLATDTNATSGSPNQNPVTLDSTGSTKIFLSAASNKFVLQDQLSVPQSTDDKITGSAIASSVPNSAGSQIINQASVTTLSVNNLNGAAYINGDRSTDNSVAIQTAVNACTGTCNIVLVNAVIGAQIVLPLNVDITFTAIGPVRVTTTSPAFYRYQATSAALAVANHITFTGISFTKTNAGIIIWDNLFFNSSTNMGITVHGCHFQLSNVGAIAIALSGDSGTIISDNVFDTGPGLVGTAIETITDNVSLSSGAQYVRTPMIATIANNTFRYGVAFVQTMLRTGADPGEGFTFTGNHFIGATITLSGLEMNVVGNEFVGAHVTLKDLSGSIFTANYLDAGNVPSQTLLTVDSVIHQQITGNNFNSGGQLSTTLVAFVNPRALHTGTTTVTLTGNIYVGANNGLTGCPSACVYTPTGGFGIVFDDPAARNIYVGGENFRQMSDALKFTAALDRSTIESFEARDVFYYAHNISTFAGSFLIASHLYNVIRVNVTGYIPIAGLGAHNIAASMVYFPPMFPGFTQALTQPAGDSCSTGAAPILTASANGARYVLLQAGASSPVGQAHCDVTITLDGSVYVAPR